MKYIGLIACSQLGKICSEKKIEKEDKELWWIPLELADFDVKLKREDISKYEVIIFARTGRLFSKSRKVVTAGEVSVYVVERFFREELFGEKSFDVTMEDVKRCVTEVEGVIDVVEVLNKVSEHILSKIKLGYGGYTVYAMSYGFEKDSEGTKVVILFSGP
ncbi:MAG: hypothetical protein DRJ40_11715 [Thermoprotei archaeon]|nr:MAG: hypothetical protein DRJ40_11715 [Thermoprotei archaeon]